ncbi:MAG: FAD-binding oxidoreductase [Rhodobacteraceae bacterium]|nr:FAD-binding oxidoreductase [Paracoccaceae bacterium]
MNPLFRNDRPGAYPDSWYAASTELPPKRAPLTTARTADVAIVGAGFTGLWAALELARRGVDVVVLEAHRAAFGASGRNGGQVGSGFNKSQSWLEARLGAPAARALWEMAEEAKAQLRDFCASHAPEARYLPGVADCEYTAKDTEASHEEAAFLHKRYGYDQITPLDKAGVRDLVRTELYGGGRLDMGAGHLHPLRYGLALAREAERAGAVIFEGSAVTAIAEGDPATLTTGNGHVTARHVILAGNGYLPGIAPPVAARVMPINSFIAATAPLGAHAGDVLGRDIAVADSKFVVNYYRMSEDRRLLFGGRESYSIGFPSDIKTKLVARMTHLFPQLEGVKIDYVWGGTLGITMTRLPCVMRIGSNILNASGFSGHGVALSGFAGKVMAEAIVGQTARFDILSTLPIPRFPGGAAARAPLLTLAMTWYALRDRLGV